MRSKLEPSSRRGVVWVDGPAGTGKSTLAGAVLLERSAPGIWLRLDGEDRDPATLFHDLGRAVRAAGLEAGAWPTFGPEDVRDVPGYVRRALDTLAASGPYTLVLDSAEAVGEAHGLIELLSQATVRRPIDALVVVTSREPPPATLSRLRVEGSLGRIDGAELRLTRAEAWTIAEREGLAQGQPSQVDRAYERSAGWVAGFVLMLRGMRDDAADVAELTNELLLDYLDNESYAVLSPAEQDVLLTVWPLPELSSAVVDRAYGARGSELLAGLAQRHVLVEMATDGVFRLHALLRELLEQRARTGLTAEERAMRHRALAEALAHQGHPEPAIDCWLRAGDWDRAAESIAQRAPELLARARYERLRGWVDRLPSEHRQPGRAAHLWRALADVPEHPRDARRELHRAFVEFREAGDWRSGARAWTGIAESMWLQWGDFAEVEWLIGELDWLAEAGLEELAAPRYGALGPDAMLLLCLLRPDDPALAFWTEVTDAASRSDGPADQRLYALHTLLVFHAWLWGDRAVATSVLERGRALEDHPELSALTRASWHFAVASYCFWLEADVAGVRDRVDRGLACGRERSVHQWDFRLHTLDACAALASREHERARQCLERMRATLDARQALDVSFHAWTVGWSALLDGADADARAHALETWRSVASGPVSARLLTRLSLAQSERRTGSPRSALRSALAIIGDARRVGATMMSWLARLVAARAAVEVGRRRRGVALLRGALEQGRRARFVTLPWWNDEDLQWLCNEAITHGIDPGYVHRLARANGLEQWRPPSGPTQSSLPVRVRALGTLRVEVEGHPVRVGRKGGALLSVLASRGGVDVPVSEVSDALWPQAEGDRARRALDTTLHRLRQRIGVPGAIVLREGRLSLDPSVCWLDVRALEEHVRLALEGDHEAWRAALDLARGSGAAASRWPAPLGERLRRDLSLVAGRILQQHVHEGRPRVAVEEGQQMLEIDELNEGVYQVLLGAAQQLGAPALAKETYRRCRRVLSEGLGTVPSEHTDALYDAAVD